MVKIAWNSPDFRNTKSTLLCYYGTTTTTQDEPALLRVRRAIAYRQSAEEERGEEGREKETEFPLGATAFKVTSAHLYTLPK